MADKIEEYLIREFAIKSWLEDVLCVEDLSAFVEEEEGEGDLRAVLQNGVILCNLMLNLRVKSIPRVNLGKDLELGFKKRENINFFLQACEDNGLHSSKLFRINDLIDFEKGQFMRVVECLEKLADKADKEWEFYFKLKSVEELKKKRDEGKLKISFTEKDRKRAETILARWESIPTAKNTFGQEPRKIPPAVPPRARSPPPREEEDELPPFPQRRPSFSGGGSSGSIPTVPGKINIPEAISNPTTWTPKPSPNVQADVSGLKSKFEQPQPQQQPLHVVPRSPRSLIPKPAPEQASPVSSTTPISTTPSVSPPPPKIRGLTQEEIIERGVVRVQALYRGWKARKDYRNRVRNVAYRQNVATEIFKTEDDYVKSLRILFTAYLDPIKETMEDSKWKLAPKGEEVEFKTFKGLYSDLQVIVNYNAKLLGDIEPLVQNWGPHQKLGHIFVQLSNFLKVYTQYVKDYEQARMEFTNAKKSSATFRKFMQDLEEKHKDVLESQDMSAFLIRPVQRIPRYLLLLKDLTKHTDADHTDYESLQKALAAIENVAIYIEQKAEESDNVHMVTSIQSRFVNKSDSLVSAGRKFVRQGDLMVLGGKAKIKRERTMFLFNDILVEAKKTKNKLGDSKMAALMGRKRSHTVAITSNGGKDLRFKKVYQLKYLRPIDMPDDDKNVNWFVLENTSQGEVVLRLYAADKLTKTEWVLDLRTIRDKLDKDQKQREVFMSSLKGTDKLRRAASQAHMENTPTATYGPQTTETPTGPPVLPPKRSTGRKANPFGPQAGGGSAIIPSNHSTSTATPTTQPQGGKVLEKSHSYQAVLNSTKEPESKSLTKKIRAGSFSKTSVKSASCSEIVIQENVEKATDKPKKKRLAMLHGFNK